MQLVIAMLALSLYDIGQTFGCQKSFETCMDTCMYHHQSNLPGIHCSGKAGYVSICSICGALKTEFCAAILADDSGSMKAMENGERIQDLEAMLARIAGKLYAAA